MKILFHSGLLVACAALFACEAEPAQSDSPPRTGKAIAEMILERLPKLEAGVMELEAFEILGIGGVLDSDSPDVDEGFAFTL